MSKILEWDASLTSKQDEHGWTPLHLAASLGDAFIVEKLLVVDQSAAYMQDKDDKNTPLHLAAGRGRIEAAKMLIKHCPDCFEILNNKQHNFLHYAGEHGQDGLIKAIAKLEQFRFLFSEVDEDGKTPLHLLSNSKDYVEDLSRMKPYNDIISLVKDQVHPPKGRHYLHGEEDKFQDRANFHLLVAALVATVSFAAGFTVPGGTSDGGTDKPPAGRAYLEHLTTYKVFLLADSVALLLSTIAILLYLVGHHYVRSKKVKRFEYCGAVFTFYSIAAMMVAFICGTHAMLDRPWLRAAVVGIGCSSFLVYYLITSWYRVDVWRGKK